VCRDADAPVTIYHIGNPGDKEHWWDLCAGPHVKSTGKINPDAVEIERTSGAYWRGDETKQMLTRVYGTAWQTEEQLRAYHYLQEEAERRDHRKLGSQLQLFSIQVRHPLRMHLMELQGFNLSMLCSGTCSFEQLESRGLL
jgi:threonyl-tRNA synthetase